MKLFIWISISNKLISQISHKIVATRWRQVGWHKGTIAGQNKYFKIILNTSTELDPKKKNDWRLLGRSFWILFSLLHMYYKKYILSANRTLKLDVKVEWMKHKNFLFGNSPT